jgi:hypothetical protein
MLWQRSEPEVRERLDVGCGEPNTYFPGCYVGSEFKAKENEENVSVLIYNYYRASVCWFGHAT